MSGPDPFANQKPGVRTVRSFVMRKGRITPAQQRALDTHWGRFGVDWQRQPLTWERVFQRPAPLVVEVGFGNGDALAAMAVAEANKNFVGIEVYPPGVGALLQKLAQGEIENVRIVSNDAVDVLRDMFPDHSIAELRLYFPDPWPKKRHHKRRLVQPGFVRLLAEKIKAGGLLHMATDWEPYAEQMSAVMQASDDFVNTAGEEFVPRPAWRPETHFERRGRDLGHHVWDLIYRRA